MEELNGVSPKTLSDTLKKLEAEDLVNRESFNEIPPRVEYTLTRDGAELRKAIIPLLRWAAKRDGLNKNRCVPTYKKISAHKMKNTDCHKGHLSYEMVPFRICPKLFKLLSKFGVDSVSMKQYFGV